jgi:hypothetical protein
MNYLLPIATLSTAILIQLYYAWRLKKVERSIEAALEKKVDEVLNSLKQEVPMASTFIRGSLEEKLRQKALDRVKKLLPDLKESKGGASLIAVPLLIALGVAALIVILNLL